jgi:hypothetical protein
MLLYMHFVPYIKFGLFIRIYGNISCFNYMNSSYRDIPKLSFFDVPLSTGCRDETGSLIEDELGNRPSQG